MTSIRVQVVLAGPVVPAWQAACVRALRALDGVDVAVSAGIRPFRASRLGTLLRAPALSAVRVDADAVPFHEPDVTLDLAGDPIASGGGETWRFRIGEAGDEAAPFVREIGRGDTSVSIELVRSDRSGTAPIRRGRFPVTRWYPGTLRWSLLQASAWPAILAAARRDGAVPAALPPQMPAAAGKPAAFERLRFGAMLVRRLAGYAVERLFETTEWNVGFAPVGLAGVVAGEPLDVRWLPRPARGTFIADPFVIERAGRTALFVEQYDARRKRGVIEALELDAQRNVLRRATVIERATHLSYPYPVVVADALYLVPENSAGRDVALYRCVEFPWRWERESAVFDGFDGLDTSLFQHGERWWAWCTRASAGSDFALYAYHAPSPQGPWLPHALNPIVEDIASARPAGAPFAVDGALYRCGQDCSRSYGGGLTIARVDELTPCAYRETIVRRLGAAEFGRYDAGVHTLGAVAGGIVLDGKHTYRDPGKLIRR